MPRPCSVCTSENRSAIDAAIVSGQPFRRIAPQYGVSPTAVARHSRAHLSPAIVAVAQEHEAERIVTLLDRVARLVDAAESILKTAQDTGRPALALTAIREVRESLKLLGAASGELRDTPSVQILNLTASPDWVRTRSALMAALGRHPEARADVVAALARLDATPALGPGEMQ